MSTPAVVESSRAGQESEQELDELEPQRAMLAPYVAEWPRAGQEAGQETDESEPQHKWVALVSGAVLLRDDDVLVQKIHDDVLLDLNDPPLPSYLLLCPRVSRLNDDPPSAYILAADERSGRILLQVVEGSHPDIFVCDTHRRTVTIPPRCPTMFKAMGIDILPVGFINDLNHDGEYLVAQLHPSTSDNHPNRLICYNDKSTRRKWFLRDLNLQHAPPLPDGREMDGEVAFDPKSKRHGPLLAAAPNMTAKICKMLINIYDCNQNVTNADGFASLHGPERLPRSCLQVMSLCQVAMYPGHKGVDGMDVLAAKQACKSTKEHAVANGPVALEMDTYRYHGHSMSDPGSTFQIRDEISSVRQERDPIERVRKLIDHGLATSAEFKEPENTLTFKGSMPLSSQMSSAKCSDGVEVPRSLKLPAEGGLVERRCQSLMSRRRDIDFIENSSYQFYKGQIFNTVTWPLDGSSEEVANGHLFATGHHRLWHFANGMILDVRRLFGPGRFLYTTAVTGTFYMKYTYRRHHVTLPIDGRLAWDFGIQNKYGTFEFLHRDELMYLDHFENWKMLSFSGAYSREGICPNDLGNTPMGPDAARYACEILSEYKGELPVPEVVRESCAVLMQYGPEALKFNEVLEKTVPSLRDNSEQPLVPITLNSLSPVLVPIERRWSNFGGVGLQSCMWRLNHPTLKTEPKLRKIAGVVTTVDQALEVVNVIPYNRIPFLGNRKRLWKAFELDQEAHRAGGRPHVLSQDFARPWPYNTELVTNTPSDRFIKVGNNLQHTDLIKAKGPVRKILNAIKRSPK